MYQGLAGDPEVEHHKWRWCPQWLLEGQLFLFVSLNFESSNLHIAHSLLCSIRSTQFIKR